jgi:phosphoglycerate kinase
MHYIFMKKITDLKPERLRGVRVLVRSDMNVPIQDGHVHRHDAARIHASLETITFLKQSGARIIVLTHLGRAGESTRPLAEYINTLFPIGFAPDYNFETLGERIEAMPQGSVILLENVRSNPREEANDHGFAESLANLADLYVNDAFAVSHRQHASIDAIVEYLPSYAGHVMIREVSELESFRRPKRPAGLILGGAKFETKIPLLEYYTDRVEKICIGGALANNFLKAQGCEIGASLYEPGIDLGHYHNDPRLCLPVDVRVVLDDTERVCGVDEVRPDEVIVDIGPKTEAYFGEIISTLETVIWNGPLGKGENRAGTWVIAEAIARANTQSVVGGGDSVATIDALGLQDSFSFISTGGGAMLDFLAHGTLPGIDALNRSVLHYN